MTADTGDDDGGEEKKNPVFVAGGTGNVGRRVVRLLLERKRPVRALVRNAEKAREIFGDNQTKDPLLSFVVVDLTQLDNRMSQIILERSIKGCDAVISVTGGGRISKWTDYLYPRQRLFEVDASKWCDDDKSHPYYTNYLAQDKLAKLAEKHDVPKFIRLTGLSLSGSAFHPFNIAMNAMLSMTNRYNLMGEMAIADCPKLTHVIFRPGGLLNEVRDPETTNVQVKISDGNNGATFPFAKSKIGRDDVAALCVAAAIDPDDVVPSDCNGMTLACRWVGESIGQGRKQDGKPTAEECLREGAAAAAAKSEPTTGKRMKPYAVAVSFVVYPAFVASVLVAITVGMRVKKIVLG